MNKIWYDLKELIEREVSKVVMKNELIPQDIEMLDKVTDIAKDICCMDKDEAEKYGFERSGKRFAMEYPRKFSGGYILRIVLLHFYDVVTDYRKGLTFVLCHGHILPFLSHFHSSPPVTTS